MLQGYTAEGYPLHLRTARAAGLRRAGWVNRPSVDARRSALTIKEEAHLATSDTRHVTTASAVNGRRSRLAARYWLAARVGVWICVLAVRVRFSSLRSLLADLTESPHGGRARGPALDVDTVVSVVTAVARFPLFRTALFPRECVRRSLSLYRALARMGHPAAIHFGVRRVGTTFLGHSWVTLRGRCLDEPGPPDVFTVVYSYPEPAGAEARPVSSMEMISV